MQFSTLVTLTFATFVLGNNPSSVTQCQTITSTIDPHGQFATCTVLACIEIKPVTQKCGCPPVGTTNVLRTACPTSCGSTSYITAIEDCFPTPPPSSSKTTTSNPVTTTTPGSSSTTTSSQPSSTTHPTLPPQSSSTTKSHPPDSSSTTTPPNEHHSTTTPPTQNPYTNTTKTVTTTEHTTITLTTCPASCTCTGQTTTVTSTEPCPSSTCVCVLPSVVFTTTVLPGPSQSQESQVTTNPPATTQAGNTPPSPRPTASIIETNVAGRFGFEAGLGLVAALLVAVAGFL